MSNGKISSKSEWIAGRRQILRNLGLAAGAGVGAAAVSHGATPTSNPGASMRSVSDPSFIDPGFDSRSVSFENPTGARGMGGQSRGGPLLRVVLEVHSFSQNHPRTDSIGRVHSL